MTRVIASLAELGFVARTAHPVDGRQVLVSVSRPAPTWSRPSGAPARSGSSSGWRNSTADERRTLLVAADLMSAIVDESA